MHSIDRVQTAKGVPCTSNPILCGITPCLNLPAFELRDFSHDVRWLTPRSGLNYVQLNLHKPAVIHSMNIILKGEVQVMKELCVLSRLNESRKISRGVSWGLSLMGLFLTGCLFPEMKPCHGLELGDELLIEVGEPYRSTADVVSWEPVTCPDFGVEPGAVLSARVDHLVGEHSCLAGTGELRLLNELQLEVERADMGDVLFEGKYEYYDERTSCRGKLRTFFRVHISTNEHLERGKKYKGNMFFSSYGSGENGCYPGCEGRFLIQASLK